MNFSYVLDLQEMSLLKVAIAIYNLPQNSFFEKMLKVPLYKISDKNVETILKHNIAQTFLPGRLQMDVMSLIKPISLEVERWKKAHSRFLHLNVDLRKFLSWKSDGTIDRLKTAENLIKEDVLSVVESFRLACHYWLSECARSLWLRMSEFQRKELHKENTQIRSPEKYHIAILQERRIKLQENHCRTATAYRHYLAQATSKQRKFFLKFPLEADDIHISRFWLSQMEEDELGHAFEIYGWEILTFFVDRPWLHFFIEVANHLWDSLPKCCFWYVFEFIIKERIESGWTDFDYEELLLQFWCQSPSSFKDYAKQDRDFDMGLLKRIFNRRQIQLLRIGM